MKCYIINLDWSCDRLEFIQQQMSALGVGFERVRAVQAGEFSPAIASPALHPGEIACFLSHRKCWELVANGADEFAVIFEDDVVLSKDAGNFLKSSSWVPQNADLVKLETFGQRIFMRRLGTEKSHQRELKILASWHAGGAGYVISKRMATKLLNDTAAYFEHPVDYLLFDWDLGDLREGKIYQLDPALCIQSNLIDAGDKNLGSTILRPEGGVPKRSKGKFSTVQKVRREINRAFARVGNFILRRNRVVCQLKTIEMK